MAELTASDRQLLTYRPTPETWECGRTTECIEIIDGSPATVKSVCPGRMSGRYSKCLYCGAAKRRGAKLVWPLYEAACKRAKIEPGTSWPVKAPTEDARPARPTKRKGS